MLWRIEGTGPPSLQKDHQITADYLAFSPDLQTIATTDDKSDGEGELAIWNMETGEKQRSLTFQQGITQVQNLKYHAGGRILSAQGGGGHQLDWHTQTAFWDMTSTPRAIGTYSEIPGVSKSGKWLALPLENGVSLVETSTGRETSHLCIEDDVTSSHFWTYNNMKTFPISHFSPDGKLAAVSGLMRRGRASPLPRWVPDKLNPIPSKSMDQIVRVWDVATGQQQIVVRSCTDALFSPNGQVLATLHERRIVDLWRLPLGKPLLMVVARTTLLWMVLVLFVWFVRRRRRPRPTLLATREA